MGYIRTCVIAEVFCRSVCRSVLRKGFGRRPAVFCCSIWRKCFAAVTAGVFIFVRLGNGFNFVAYLHLSRRTVTGRCVGHVIVYFSVSLTRRMGANNVYQSGQGVFTNRVWRAQDESTKLQCPCMLTHRKHLSGEPLVHLMCIREERDCI